MHVACLLASHSTMYKHILFFYFIPEHLGVDVYKSRLALRTKCLDVDSTCERSQKSYIINCSSVQLIVKFQTTDRERKKKRQKSIGMSVTSTIAYVHNIFTFPLIARRIGIICTTAIDSRSSVWQTPTSGCDCVLRLDAVHTPYMRTIGCCCTRVYFDRAKAKRTTDSVYTQHKIVKQQSNVSEKDTLCWFGLLFTQSNALECSRVFRMLNEWAQSKFRE